jgi:chemotaxis response regulator CheB
VLIVDRWTESRRLLGELLERDGAQVIQAIGARDAAEMAAKLRPNVVVFDAENLDDDCGRTALAEAADRIDAPVVVVGTVKRNASPLPTDRFVSKPYHYRHLLRRIGECVDGRR